MKSKDLTIPIGKRCDFCLESGKNGKSLRTLCIFFRMAKITTRQNPLIPRDLTHRDVSQNKNFHDHSLVVFGARFHHLKF